MRPPGWRFGGYRGRGAAGLPAKILVLASACAMLPLLGVGAYLLRQNERMLAEQARDALASDAALAAVAALMVAVLAVNIAASRRLLRSLHRLAEGARQMSAGHLDVELPVHGIDEMFELTVAFNEMARRVREAHNHLARANTGLRAANHTLAHLSITDGLTGLYNHRHFYETLGRELQRSDRESSALSLLILDLDRFKEYNDRHGHTEGDAALRVVAQEVVASVRGSDLAFRYGGEELAVLLPACTADEALAVAEKVRAAVETAGRRVGFMPVSVSIGVATCPEQGTTARALVSAADAALYGAKRAGRNRVVPASPSARLRAVAST
jgi:diguanylate cyclase (GGDEF)-like protein